MFPDFYFSNSDTMSGMETITLTMKEQKRVLDYLTGMREGAKIDSQEQRTIFHSGGLLPKTLT